MKNKKVKIAICAALIAVLALLFCSCELSGGCSLSIPGCNVAVGDEKVPTNYELLHKEPSDWNDAVIALYQYDTPHVKDGGAPGELGLIPVARITDNAAFISDVKALKVSAPAGKECCIEGKVICIIYPDSAHEYIALGGCELDSGVMTLTKNICPDEAEFEALWQKWSAAGNAE